METPNEQYLDLTPKEPEQEEVQDLEIRFEIDIGNAGEGLEGIPTMDLEIGLTDF